MEVYIKMNNKVEDMDILTEKIKPKQTELSVITEVHVRFSEVDSMDIVWHGNYVKYIEDGREDFGNKYGIGYQNFKENGYGVPIVNLEISYKKSLIVGDTVLVKTIYVPTDSAKLVFSFVLTDLKTKKVVCTAKSTQVFLDKDNNMLLIAPKFYQKWKSKWS
jgi:acyl-CoA thioester hydrolase